MGGAHLRIAAAVAALAMAATGAKAQYASSQPPPFDDPRPKPVSETACAALKGQARKDLAGQRLTAVGAYLSDHQSYGKALESWRIQQLINTGAWTSDEHQDREKRLKEDPRLVELLAAMDKSTDDHDRALAALEQASEESGEPPCSAIASMAEAEERLMDLDAAYVDRLDELYLAEARRAGVELGERRAPGWLTPTARPGPFKLARPAPVTEAGCSAWPAESIHQAALDALRARNLFANAINDHTVTGMRWRVQRLAELGVWPKEEDAQQPLFKQLMTDPQIQTISGKLAQLTDEARKERELLRQDSAAGKPTAVLCQRAVALLQVGEQVIDTYFERDRRAQAMFAEEAARRGVRLD